MNPAITFNDRCLSSEDREWLADQKRKLHLSAMRAAREVLDLGTLLLQVRKRIGHGRFVAWCRSELPWSRQQTWRMMRAASVFTANGEMSHCVTFEPTALYVLSQPSTPQTVREYALGLAKSGEKVTGKIAKEILKSARATPKLTLSKQRELAPLRPEDKQLPKSKSAPSPVDAKPAAEWLAVEELATKSDQVHITTIDDGEDVLYSASVYKDGRPRTVVGADLATVMLELADRLPKKECRRCKASKPVNQFSANALTSDGKNSYCRECEKRRSAAGKKAKREGQEQEQDKRNGSDPKAA